VGKVRHVSNKWNYESNLNKAAAVQAVATEQDLLITACR